MKRYIRESDLRAITEGSFERKRQACMEAIDAFEKTVSPVPRPVALVATFEHHAVVADAAGVMHRYTFREGKALVREVYSDFTTMTESEAGKDQASIIEDATAAVRAGKDPTDSILKLLRL